MTRCGALAAGFKEDTTLLAAIWGRWSEAARHWCQPPFLDIRLDEDKAHLPKIDMHSAWPVCAYSWEEILCLQAVDKLFELFAIPSEEDGAGSWPVAYSDDVALC